MSQYNTAGDILVIERESDSQPNPYVYITIAFVYAFLVSLIVDKMLNYSRVEKVCENRIELQDILNDKKLKEHSAQREVCLKASDAYDEQKFTYMFAIGILSFLGGSMIARYEKSLATGGMGLSIGGIVIVVHQIFKNWAKLKELRIFLLAVVFIALFYGSSAHAASIY